MTEIDRHPIIVHEWSTTPFISEPPQQRAFRVLLSPLLQPGAPAGASVSTAEVYPNQTTPWHSHETQTEIWYVIEGNGRVRVGDVVVEARPGTVVTAPCGVPHQLVNPSAVAFLRCLVIFTPAGPEGMFLPEEEA